MLGLRNKFDAVASKGGDLHINPGARQQQGGGGTTTYDTAAPGLVQTNIQHGSAVPVNMGPTYALAGMAAGEDEDDYC
jgi:hypothetical protein